MVINSVNLVVTALIGTLMVALLILAVMLRERRMVVTVVRADRLPDAKITEILRAAPEGHLLYRAFMQILEDAEREAVDDVAEGCWNKLTMAMHAGGARYLKAVRENVLQRRVTKKTSNVQRPTSNA